MLAANMKHPYRVYKNGRYIARGNYAAASFHFAAVCSKSNPAEDVVLLTTHYNEPLNSF